MHLSRFDYIDALRGWAAIGVMVVHSQNFGSPPKPLLPLVQSGANGVQLFFIISAFTLFYSLYRRSEFQPVKRFMVRRFFRIAPLFWVVAVVSLLSGNSSPGYWAPEGVSSLGVLSTFLFVNGWVPEWQTSLVEGGWTLAVEMNFYLLVPLCFLLIQKLRVAVMAVPVTYFLGHFASKKMVVFYAPYYTEHPYLIQAWSVMNFPACLYVFCFGILVFFILKEFEYWMKKISPQTWAFLFYTLVFFVILIFYKHGKLEYRVSLFFCIVVVASQCKNIFLTSRLMIFLGKISYSTYLLHFFVIRFLKYFFNEQLTWFAGLLLTIAFTVPLAYLSYRLIEQPFQKIGKRIIDGWEKQKTYV